MKTIQYRLTLGSRSISARSALVMVCGFYLAVSAIHASMNLDIDEFAFIREPYELLGGDYTMGYLKAHDYGGAMNVAARAYYFYWNYRPLFSPIVSMEDKAMFAREEERFGYVKPEKVVKGDTASLAKYSKRLIVPEPDRFYSHGAGKPLLPAILSIPQLALTQVLTPGGDFLLRIQHEFNYHPAFILIRLAQILSGLATILILFWILSKDYAVPQALLGAALVAVAPLSVRYFPNLHHDSIAIPFITLAGFFFAKERYVKAGIFFGLALASKNTAIFLGAGFIALTAWEIWRERRSGVPPRDRSLSRRMKGLLIVAGLGLLVMLPFSNPVSFVNEIFTPITHRAYDPRGEDVDSFTLSATLASKGTGGMAHQQFTGLRIAEEMLRLPDIGFFFLALLLFLLPGRTYTPLMRLSIVMILLLLPYAILFSTALGYRMLLFIPFFALLCTHVAPPRGLTAFLVVLAAVDLLMCMDPIANDRLHIAMNAETFWQAFARWVTGLF